MVDINFPTSPALDDTYTFGGKTWKYNGIGWVGLTTSALAAVENTYAIPDGAAFEIDPANGTMQRVTLGANRTPKGTNFLSGQSMTLRIKDGTAYAITWTDTTFGTGGVSWVGGSPPTLDPTNWTVVVLWKEVGQVYGKYVGVVV
jgi:hypothetical protein